MVWGFLSNEDRDIEREELIRQEAKKAKVVTKEGMEIVSPKYLKKRLVAYDYAKLERKKQKEYLKRQHQAELKSGKFFAKVDEATRGLVPSRRQIKSSLGSIGRSIQSERASWDMTSSRTAGTTARSIVTPPRRHLSQENFFEHKDEIEVYGDEGLTFFDSNKKGNGQRTGELFGF